MLSKVRVYCICCSLFVHVASHFVIKAIRLVRQRCPPISNPDILADFLPSFGCLWSL